MGDNKIESLERLAALFEKEVLTPEEYAHEKARILAEASSSLPPPSQVDRVSLKRRVGGPLLLLLVGGILGLWVAGGPRGLACYAGSARACSEASSLAFKDTRSRAVPNETDDLEWDDGGREAWAKYEQAKSDEVARAESAAALGLRFEERACRLGSEDDCGWQGLRAECRSRQGRGTACQTLILSGRN